MLSLRDEQLQQLRSTALNQFESEMVSHAALCSPRIYEIIGEDSMRLAVRQVLARGRRRGFTLRGPLRQFVECALFFGSSFDTDPQHEPIQSILATEQDEMGKSEAIHRHVLEYQANVAGPNGIRVTKALDSLSNWVHSPNPALDDSPLGVHAEFQRAFPEKADFVGKPSLLRLIGRAHATSTQLHFESPRAKVLVAILMFSFGHGCFSDPLYPWISRTLEKHPTESPSALADRLEKRALIWLEHVLAAPGGTALI